MARLELSGIRKSFGNHEVIKGADLTVNDGEFCVFVGPSGCGKSTLLRIIAGLEMLSAGEVRIGDKRVNDTDPSDRGIAMVFQSYALYPHMNVRENMGFGLRMAGVPKAEIAQRVERAAAILQITPLLTRRPAQLSGGQRQRVAIGRAIVREPEIFLFDEPLSNLDAELRVQMRVEIAKLHKALGVTMIYVTHDQTEAMTMADRIVVMRAGIIEQVGSPLELYKNPDNTFVAGFLGSPRMNFISAKTSDNPAVASLPDGQTIQLPALAKHLASGTEITIGIRPEHMARDAAENTLSFNAELTESLGTTNYVHARGPSGEKIIVEQRELTTEQDTVRVAFHTADVTVFGGDELRIR